MSVRVNLLPEATKQKDRAGQQRSLVGLAAVVLFAALGGVYLWALSQVGDAEEVLLAEQARTSELRGDEAELVAFRELADRRDQSLDTLRLAMTDEVSAAGILQDIAAVLPSDTELETLTVTLAPQAEPTVPEVMGTINITGRSLASHAPGVERVLLSLDKIISFRGLYLNSSSLDEPEGRVVSFSLDGQVGPEATTGRYVDGLPEDLG